ncbi:hypothetical protein PG994_012027 [Apiospora phragmitis]|uniref:Uncharacterized protein n=1 Tax=Apiospora phragmitis TaxID=2905665 RepID=A0ABR1TUK6_9PEZI
MQLAIFLTSIAAGTNAAVVPRQGTDNPRLAQFRIFSDVGCSNLNQGFYTVDRDQAGTCSQLNNVPVESIELQGLETAGQGCELRLYYSEDCAEEAVVADLNVCKDATETGPSGGTPTWNSWQMVCPSSA